MVKKITTEQKDELNINDIKEEIVNYSKNSIDDYIENSFKKLEKKLIRRKNIKIIKRDILIIILLAIISFMGYKMYKNNYFDKYINNTKEVIKEKVEDENEDKKGDNIKEDVVPEKDLSFHKVALDNYYININSNYVEDYYNGNLTSELLLTMTLNNLDNDVIINDDDTYFINDGNISDLYTTLFDSEYENKSFKYNGTSIKYLKTTNQYMSLEEIKISNSKNIKRYVSDIKEEDNIVKIYTIEYTLKDNKVYNILNKKEVCSYKDVNSIVSNKDKLNSLEYEFIYENGTYILKNINKM